MEIQKEQLEKVINEIKSNFHQGLNDENYFNTFIEPIKILNIKNNKIFLYGSSQYIIDSLNEKWSNKFAETLNKKLNSNFIVWFTNSVSDNNNQQTIISTNYDSGLDHSFTFDNFVVGSFNKMAFAAGQTLFTKKYFNPIFLSGEVGLGKTHLLHAIGNKYLQLFPNKKVKYITSDNFIRQTYNALSNQNDEIEKLKDLYQSYDLLLLDDIQFFSRKEKINEIFFHIFNNNISKNKIIVLSSDKPVNQLEHFEDRMKSRFASGLIINISKPSLESIKNIFNSKLENEEHSFKFSNDALEYIARRHNDDIRKLEGFLNKIIFYAVTNLPPNAIITEEVIKKNIDVEVKEELKSKGFDFDPNILIDQICNVYGVEPKMIKSKIKTKQISQVRHICMYALRQKFNMSYEQIGSLFQKHHTTVIEAITNVEKLLKKDENLKNFIENIYRRL